MPTEMMNTFVVDRGRAEDPPCLGPDPVGSAMHAAETASLEHHFNPYTDKLLFVLNNRPEARTHVSLHHLNRCDTAITVAPCSAQCIHIAEGKWVASVDASSAFKLDVLKMAADVAACFQKVQKWEPGRIMTIPSLKPLLQEEARRASNDESILPFRVGVDDLAIVPASRFDLDRIPGSSNMTKVVEVLTLRGAYIGSGLTSVYPDDLDGVHLATIQAMERIGAVRVTTSEFGELLLALNSSFVVWKFMRAVQKPLPLPALSSSLPTSKKTKLELILWLQHEGWADDPALVDPLVQGGALCDRRLIGRPRSYFQALAESRALFEKGHPSGRAPLPIQLLHRHVVSQRPSPGNIPTRDRRRTPWGRLLQEASGRRSQT